MKRKFIGLLCILLICNFIVSCSRADKNTPQDQQTGVAEKEFKGDFLTLRYTGDWEIKENLDDKSLMMNIKGDEGVIIVLIKAELDRFKPAEDSANHFAQIYEGTSAKHMIYGQNEYYGTTFLLNVPQTIMVTKAGDYRILVTLQGVGHDQDKRVIDMLNSIEYSL